MNRRDFLQLSAAAFLPDFTLTPAGWRRFEITTRLEIHEPRGAVRAWVPLPSIHESQWIKPLGDRWIAEGGKAVTHRVAPYGAKLLYVEWPDGVSTPVVEVHSRVETRDRACDLSKPGKDKGVDRKFYTAPTHLIPTDGIVADTAAKITAGATTDLEKARRIYEWVVANTFRDSKVRGCGIGDVASMLRVGNLGGKCADLNALFVGLCRASGIPARDLYGIRVAPSKFGYKSLGANSEVVTKSQHCRAEVYLTGFGWVPADPADVRKVVLEEPPGNLPIDDPKVAAAHKTLFGAWETNWIAYNDAHDVALPGSSAPPIGFLMYPQAETAAGRRDSLDADAFKYVITAKEIAY